MKKRIYSLLFALSCVVMVMAQKTSVYAYSQNTVECLGTELDGSQTVRVSGIGRTRADSREQCKKNAVWAVLFKGIRGGIGDCNMKPIITEANAEEKYEEYFNIFFMDGGEYLKYVSMEDTKKY